MDWYPVPEDWIYCELSLNGLVKRRRNTLVDHEFIQEHFGSPAEYQELVMHFVKTRYLPDDVRMYLKLFD